MSDPLHATSWQMALPPGTSRDSRGTRVATKMPTRVCLNCGGEVRGVRLVDAGYRLQRGVYCCSTCRENHRNKPRIA